MNHPNPWLRYIDAAKVNDSTLELDELPIRNSAGEDLGSVNGLLIDAESGRPRYVSVDAGGWFSSRLYLVPIGELHLAPARDALIVALSKDQIDGFPGFDAGAFERLNEADIKRINTAIGQASEPGVQYPEEEPHYAAWTRPSYRVPDWWNPSAELIEPRMRAADVAVSDEPAQPGDVLGIETDGKVTHVGETDEEDASRRDKVLASVNPVRD